MQREEERRGLLYRISEHGELNMMLKIPDEKHALLDDFFFLHFGD